MPENADWVSAREAAARLGVKLQTLYAYASRGLVDSIPGASGRGRLYESHAIERLKARHDARSGHGAVAAGALRWGEPTLETSISEIRCDGPYYRGESALALAERGVGFEAVSELLWCGTLPSRTDWPCSPPKITLPARPRTPAPTAFLAAAVASAALVDDARHGASDAEEFERARKLVGWLASIVGGRTQDARGSYNASVAERMLRSYSARAGRAQVAALDRALVLCAEHELNASTFAARVTASTQADLYACLGAALHALGGVRHGAMSTRVEALLEEIGSKRRAAAVVRERLARGDAIAGFGHPLYPDGDPRARALLTLAHELRPRGPALATLDALLSVMHRARHPPANLDVGLVALCNALALPRGAATAVFAIGRTAGWVAHALEQRRQGHLLRPRARYVAPT